MSSSTAINREKLCQSSPFLPKARRSDDDSDIEWTHLWFMYREGSASAAMHPGRDRNLETKHEPGNFGVQTKVPGF